MKPALVESIERDLRDRIPPSVLTFTFTRSGGPGGQNVNKVSTRVTLWFDLEGCGTLTATEKARIRQRLAGRISRDGRLHVVAMRHRTQSANRRAAVERFYELLADALTPEPTRRPTRTPPRARQRRLREKRFRSEVKQSRRSRPQSDQD